MVDFKLIIKHCNDIVTDPYAWIGKQNNAGVRYCGYTCIFFPEEIIHAGGITPIRLFASYRGNDCSEKYLHNRTCEYARNLLESFEKGHYAFLDTCVFTTGCNTLQAVFKNLENSQVEPFFMNVPLSPLEKSGSIKPYTVDFLDYELKKLVSFVEKKFDVDINPERLKNSLQVYNENSGLLKKLLRFRNQNKISAIDYFTIFKVGYFMRKEKHNELLNDAVEALKGSDSKTLTVGREKIRIVVSGFVNGEVDFLKNLEDSGIDIVADDLCEFSRYSKREVNGGMESPLLEIGSLIVQKYCPLKVKSTDHFSLLQKECADKNALGVIFLTYPFCDPQSIDLAGVRHDLQEAGIPSIVLQPSINLENLAQIETRVEAFLEMLYDQKL